MSLTIGTRLGPYEILGSLGAGGMGEVYRARDTRLDRDVAVKLIRAELAEHSDFQHRFEREARAISALSHPHICSLHDIGTQDGVAYLIMEYVDGETLTAVLARGALPVSVALQYAIEITDALAAAHRRGLIHRDLKPSNIMITPAGVKVLDFGLAKRSHDATPDEATEAVSSSPTRHGQVVGTISYMSPEQAEGRPIDARSDVFSLGVVFYEMLCGTRPFRGETSMSTIASILRDAPQAPRKLRPETPDDVERIVLRCLEKKPADRYESAALVLDDLRKHVVSSVPARRAPVRRTAIAVVLVLLTVAAVAGSRMFIQASRARWAEREALPEVARLMNAGRPLLAWRLLQQAEQYLESSPESIRLRDGLFVSRVAITTVPTEADVFIRDYSDAEVGESGWERLGRTPIEPTRLPRGFYRVRAVRDGFEPVERAVGLGGSGLDAIPLRLHPSDASPPGMVWLPGIGTTSRGTSESFPAVAPAEAGEFWIDRHEVTNQQFKDFVDRGGYQRRELWTQPFVKDGRTLSRNEAMAEFRDRTGRPGPATWQHGTYAEGTADFPVGGVSWFEAAAYAEFAGRSLPTVYHWYRAAGGAAEILKFANFGGEGPARVGSNRGLGPWGTLDMAGNVKEWAWNPSGDLRYVLGGGWNEPTYLSFRPDARRPFDRDPTFGIRLAKYVQPLDPALTGSVPIAVRDRRTDGPVDDRTFAIYKGLHAYDHTDLKPLVESMDDSSPYWRKEKVTFQAGYGSERVIAYLYLPKNAPPPYQVAVFFGGTGTLSQRSLDDDEALVNFGFIVRSGRAVMLPAYKGTLDRGPGAYYHLLGQPNLWREMNLQWSKDLGRSIDYLETRADLDARRLAFLGNSMGSAMAPRLLAVESRIKAAILISGGSFEKVPAEVDSWNFASRVTTPVLMLNGRDDFLFPLETSQLPLFRRLGTREADKRHVLYDGGHNVGNTGIRLDVVREALEWLDRHLGPVQKPS